MKSIAYFVRFLQFSNQACFRPHYCSLLHCLVLVGFPFYFQVTSTFLNVPTALRVPSQCFTFFIPPGLIALLLLKCSFQFRFFRSSAGFRMAFSPIAFQMHGFWELNELVLRVHWMFTGGPSWSNWQFLAAPVWEHSATTYCMAMWQTSLRSSSNLNRHGCTHTPFFIGF